jgi:hypothetical protein
MTVDEAILAFPVGQKVAFMPVTGQPFAEEAFVRSEPWLLGHGKVVLKITGRAGGVLVDNLVALKMKDQS